MPGTEVRSAVAPIVNRCSEPHKIIIIGMNLRLQATED